MSQVCQFFLRGQCKFGNKCMNLHTAGGNPPPSGNAFQGGGFFAAAAAAANAPRPFGGGGVAVAPVFAPAVPAPFVTRFPAPAGDRFRAVEPFVAAAPPNNPQAIRERMGHAKKTPWLLSCVAKDIASSNISGFVDKSPEQARLGLIEARQQNTEADYVSPFGRGLLRLLSAC